MRTILFPNGAIVMTTLDVDLEPGDIHSDISIPGYIPESLDLITDLKYDVVITGDNVDIHLYVPSDYGARGHTLLPLTYATTSIYGDLVYEYNVATDHASRYVDIDNQSGTSFTSGIGIGEADSIYLALGSTDILYGNVGDLKVETGTHVYSLDTDLVVKTRFIVYPTYGDVNMSISVHVGTLDPLPGVMNVIFPNNTVSYNLVTPYAQVVIPNDIITLTRDPTTNTYTLVSKVKGTVYLSGLTGYMVTASTSPPTPVPSTTADNSTVIYVTPGTQYTLTPLK
jgi:hypothetical protein